MNGINDHDRKRRVLTAEEIREEVLRPSRFLGHDQDRLGRYFMEREAFRLAESQFRRAVWLNPFEVDFRVHWALGLIKVKRHREARAVLADVLTTEGGHREAWELWKRYWGGEVACLAAAPHMASRRRGEMMQFFCPLCWRGFPEGLALCPYCAANIATFWTARDWSAKMLLAVRHPESDTVARVAWILNRLKKAGAISSLSELVRQTQSVVVGRAAVEALEAMNDEAAHRTLAAFADHPNEAVQEKVRTAMARLGIEHNQAIR